MKTRLLVLAALVLAAAPALAESRLEKSLRLEPGGQFRLDTDTGRVTVTGSGTSGVRITVTSRGREINDLLRFDFVEESGSVTVRARKKHLLSSWFDGGYSIRFEIEVPAQTRVDVHTSGGAIVAASLRSPAKLDTSGGSIEVRDLVGDLEADTSGGSIRLSDVKGKSRVQTSGGGIRANDHDGPLNAETSGGSVDLDHVTGDIRAHSSGGGIHIVNAGGRVEADTSGGSIETSFAHGNSRGGSLESSGGGITVSIDPAAALSIDAHGSSVRSELPLTVSGEISRRQLRGDLGKGGEKLRLRTSGGSVRIRSL